MEIFIFELYSYAPIKKVRVPSSPARDLEAAWYSLVVLIDRFLDMIPFDIPSPMAPL